MAATSAPEPDAATLSDLRRTLLLHGLEFAHNGVAHLDDDGEQAGRYAVVHLALGIELLLKARLVVVAWREVFRSPRRASLAALRNGDFKSVSAEEAIERLASQGVTIERRHTDMLENLRRLRNAVVHFPAAINQNALKPQALMAIGFTLEFIAPIAGPTAEEVQAVENLRNKALELHEFCKQRWSEIRAGLTQSPLVECTVCHEVAGHADDRGYHCAFCCVDKDGQTAVNDHIGEVLLLNAYDVGTGGGEWPLYECDACLADTMAPVSPTAATRLCFSCGNCENPDD